MWVDSLFVIGLGTSYPTANPTLPLIPSAHIIKFKDLLLPILISELILGRSSPTLHIRVQFNRLSNAQACEKQTKKTFGSFPVLLKPALLCTTRTDKALKHGETVHAALLMRLWINGLKLKLYCLITWKRSITWCPLPTKTNNKM